MERQGIIVWFQHMKNVRQFKRFGHLLYVSKGMKYAVIYVNQDQVEQVSEKLDRLPFVSKVELSYKPFIRTVYESKKNDKEKEYEFKYGL